MTGDSVIPIWLDCDPGHDDAVAILLGCFSPHFRLLGISASYGNSSPENTLYNTLSLLTALGKEKDIPVYKGAQRPWFKLPVYAPDIHGDSGLDGSTLLPKPTVTHVDGNYLDAMEQAILQNQGEISLISTGSMTSIATLLKERSHLKKHIKYISFMAGGFTVGNRNKNNSAEFNIWVDPHAANSIFMDEDIKDKCILVPLDLTHKCIATKEVRDTILKNGTKLRRLYYELFLFFAQTYKNVQGFEKGPPVHDPVALLPLLYFYGHVNNDILKFKYRRLDLNVEERSKDPDEGRLSLTSEYSLDSDCGIIVCLEVNVNFFWNQIFYALEQADRSVGSI